MPANELKITTVKCHMKFWGICFYSFLLNADAGIVKNVGISRARSAPLSNVYENIENRNIENLYFSQDLNYIYYQEKEKETDDAPMPYKVALSNPILTDKIIDYSEKNDIHPMFLINPPNPVTDTVRFIGDAANFLFTPIIGLVVFRTIFEVFRASRIGATGRPTSNPFFPSFNKGEDKLNMQKANITLQSWAGSPEILEECTEIVSYIKNSTTYLNAGAEIPKGILMEGPPGTGKTLIAKAIAGETDAWFIAVSASEFIELYVGLGAQKIRNLFRLARENKPAIIFIDEIDSIGRQRGTGINMGNDEREQTLNQLLAEMDGFSQNDNIIVIAATNRKDVLDSALLRPGRFDRIVTVPLPDRESRRAILELNLKNKKVDSEIQTGLLAEMTAGFSGAQLKNLINEAAINSARTGSIIINQKNIEDALEKIVVGIIKKTDTRSDLIKRRVAIHEVGHAFLVNHFNEYYQLKKVTIQSTYNGAGGYTLFGEYPEIAEGGLYTKDLLKKRLIIALGGKAAEQLFYGRDEVSLGAIQDLKQANQIARRMIGNYGMGNDLEVFFDETMDAGQNPFLGRSIASGSSYSDQTRETVDKEALALVDSAYVEAINILTEKQFHVSFMVDMLLKKTVLNGQEFDEAIITHLDNGEPEGSPSY
jgi:cell division protease FtsH